MEIRKNQMLNLEKIKKIDSKNMHESYNLWPEIAEESYKNEKVGTSIGEYENIVFAGMGGSGAISDIFGSILSRKPIHIGIVKGYHLPKTVNRKTLVIISSVSGNTAETVSILNQANDVKAKIISFSSGGKLEEISKKEGIEHVKIDMVNSPRASLTKYLFTMLKKFENILPIEKNEIEVAIKELKKTKENISSQNLTQSNVALDLAENIKQTPIIYYPIGLQAAATRFKNSLQENSKMHVIMEDVLETSHNGIVPWEKDRKFDPILIQGDNDFIKTKERWKIIKQYFQENDIKYREIFTEHTGILSKIINLIYLLDYSTIYRAILSEIDPTPVKSIDYVKKHIID